MLWTEAHPEQGGRVSLWASESGGEPVELAPDHNVRNAINEYGGGAWAAAQGWVVYSTVPSGELYVRGPRGGRRLLAPGGDRRYGCLVLLPRQRLVLAVREDHDGGDVTQCLVSLDLNTMNPDGGTVLASGADFYASPTLRADGMLAWVEWQLPAMPWDATRLVVAPPRVTGTSTAGTARGPGGCTATPGTSASRCGCPIPRRTRSSPTAGSVAPGWRTA